MDSIRRRWWYARFPSVAFRKSTGPGSESAERSGEQVREFFPREQLFQFRAAHQEVGDCSVNRVRERGDDEKPVAFSADRRENDLPYDGINRAVLPYQSAINQPVRKWFPIRPSCDPLPGRPVNSARLLNNEQP